MNGLLAQVRPTREYRSGTLYDTIRIIPGQPLTLRKSPRAVPMPYPAVSNAPQSAKHRMVVGGTISLIIDEVMAS